MADTTKQPPLPGPVSTLLFDWDGTNTVLRQRGLPTGPELPEPVRRSSEIAEPGYTDAVEFEDGKVMLGDEFTPDGCRIWDVQTREKLAVGKGLRYVIVGTRVEGPTRELGIIGREVVDRPVRLLRGDQRDAEQFLSRQLIACPFDVGPPHVG